MENNQQDENTEKHNVHNQNPSVHSGENFSQNQSTPLRTAPNKLIIFLIFTIIILLITSAYFGYMYLNRNSSSEPLKEAENINLPKPSDDATSNWNIYTNETYGFEIKYPTNFEVEEIYADSTSSFDDNKKILMVKITSPNVNIDLFPEGGFDHGFDPWKPINTDSTSISGESFERVKFGLDDSTDEWIIYTHYSPDTFFRIESQHSQEYSELSTQILSTLKFAKFNESTIEWDTYSSGSSNFSIQYPSGWRSVETPDWVGFGPREIGEDVVWGVHNYNKNEKSLTEIKNEFGKQFADRSQTEEIISLENITATIITTTTEEFKDWISLSVIVENNETIYVIGNGSITDENLNYMLKARTGKDYNISFEDFYKTFRILN